MSYELGVRSWGVGVELLYLIPLYPYTFIYLALLERLPK
jgi:hypothetical protein